MTKFFSQSRHKLFYFILLAAAIVLVFIPALDNEFVTWDDDVHILLNPMVKSGNVADIFFSTVSSIYIPLTTLSHAVEYHFFQFNPVIYHLNNLLLHTAVSLLVFQLAIYMGLSLQAGFIAGLIFGIHPMHVESVAWATERKDVLYSLFFMAGLLTYYRYVKGLNSEASIFQRWTWLIMTYACGTLSLLAKPMAVSFPLILFLMDWYMKRNFSLWLILEKVFLFVTFIPITLMTYQLHMRSPHAFSWDSILVWFWCFSFYIKKFFVPTEFVHIYGLPEPVTLTNPDYLSAIIVFAAAVAGLMMKNRLFCFAVLCYFLSIFFLLRFDRVHDLHIVADRFMYLPSLGICLFIGVSLNKALTKAPNAAVKKLVIAASLLLFTIYAVKTIRQIDVWQNGVTLWEHQLIYQGHVDPGRTYNHLGQAYMYSPGFVGLAKTYPAEPALTEVNKIIRLYQKARALKPSSAFIYYNLGHVYSLIKDYPSALANFDKAIYYDRQHFIAFVERGEIYRQMGDYRRMMDDFKLALAVNPENAEIRQRVIDIYDFLLKQHPGQTDFLNEKNRILQKSIPTK